MSWFVAVLGCFSYFRLLFDLRLVSFFFNFPPLSNSYGPAGTGLSQRVLADLLYHFDHTREKKISFILSNISDIRMTLAVDFQVITLSMKTPMILVLLLVYIVHDFFAPPQSYCGNLTGYNSRSGFWSSDVPFIG